MAHFDDPAKEIIRASLDSWHTDNFQHSRWDIHATEEILKLLTQAGYEIVPVKRRGLRGGALKVLIIDGLNGWQRHRGKDRSAGMPLAFSDLEKSEIVALVEGRDHKIWNAAIERAAAEALRVWREASNERTDSALTSFRRNALGAGCSAAAEAILKLKRS